MTVPVQFRIDENQLQHVKRMARLQAASEDRDIDWRDLMREAVANKFPLPKSEQDEKEGCLQK